MAKRLAVLLFVCVAAAGCGSSSPVAPSAFSQNVNGTVAAFGASRETVTAPRAGTMTVQLSWTDLSVDLDLYLAATSCTALYPQSGCGILASSANGGTTKETLTRNVASGDSFSIFVDNLNVSKAADYSISITIQ